MHALWALSMRSCEGDATKRANKQTVEQPSGIKILIRGTAGPSSESETERAREDFGTFIDFITLRYARISIFLDELMLVQSPTRVEDGYRLSAIDASRH